MIAPNAGLSVNRQCMLLGVAARNDEWPDAQ
jgi:hypothetical protein